MQRTLFADIGFSNIFKRPLSFQDDSDDSQDIGVGPTEFQVNDDPSANGENIDASVDPSGSPFHGFSTQPTTTKVLDQTVLDHT